MKCVSVKLTVEFYGYFIDRVKSPAVKVAVSSDLQKGVEEVKTFLFNAYQIESGYMIRINQESMSQRLKRNAEPLLTETDVIKIIPVMSGG